MWCTLAGSGGVSCSSNAVMWAATPRDRWLCSCMSCLLNSESWEGTGRAEWFYLHQPPLTILKPQTTRGSWLHSMVGCKLLAPSVSRFHLVQGTSPFPHDIWTEPHQQCPGSDPDPACTAALTWDERRQMTGYRVLRAGSGGFFCRHLAGCFKVFCL